MKTASGQSLPGLPGGHGGMHAKFAGLVAAAGHHTPLRGAAYDHGFADELGPAEPLYRNEERIKVEMQDDALGAGRFFHGACG